MTIDLYRELSDRPQAQGMQTIRATDRYGAEWSLFEIDRSSHGEGSAHIADGWLCFERADGHLVRVPRGEYPRDWRNKPAGELLELIGRGGSTIAD